MNEMGCEKWREAMAMHVFDDLSAEEETGLLAHLEGCSECQVVAEEIAGTFRTLSYVDLAAVELTAAVPPQLFDRVLGDLHRAGVMQRRRRRVSVSALAGAGAVAASLILVGVVIAHPATSPVQRTVALRGATTVRANAVLIDESWGTRVDLHENGLPGGDVYTVTMKTSSGTWWTAGTYRSVAGEPVNATMACAVSLKKITGIRVLNGAGKTVLTSYSGASSAPYE